MSASYVHALALGVDPAWRGLPADQRAASAEGLAHALADRPDVTTFADSMVGLRAGMDLLLWSLGPSFDVMEEAAAALLRSPMGPWLAVRESFLGLIQPSQYVKRPTEQEQSLFTGERSRYRLSVHQELHLVPPARA
ncbi:MAG TPA: chlorite dismutase family protein [Candidatus Saccharimonadales bacterium]|nr:chlorite dismutase family protein [Candidatus Saccharimonadales bacterium]